jgi:glycosyltransferase involved in cell wall biosynthesis
MPKLTVLTCVYNCERFISKCIESVLIQNFSDFEFIIIDDGSTDRTFDIIDKYAKTDFRIKYIKKINSGLTKSLNLGVQLSTTNYILRIDADDEMIQGRIFNTYNAIVYNDSDVVINQTNYIDENGVLLGKSSTLKSIENCLLNGYSPFAHSSVILKKSSLINIGCYDEFFKKSQDYDLWLRMMFNGYKFRILNFHYTNVRIHKGSITNSEVDYFSFFAYIRYCCLLNNLEWKFKIFISDQNLMLVWLQHTITFKFYLSSQKLKNSIFSIKSFQSFSCFFRELTIVCYHIIPGTIYILFTRYFLSLLFKKFKKY